jgi:asparagine N-glycosylation enzyme membrane subunit Stt3
VVLTDTVPLRRVLVIVAGVLTLAIGSVLQQKAPVVVGSAVTAAATLNELLRLSAMLHWSVLLALFGAAGVLLIGLGASYEKRRQNVARLRGALNRLR